MHIYNENRKAILLVADSMAFILLLYYCVYGIYCVTLQSKYLGCLILGQSKLITLSKKMQSE